MAPRGLPSIVGLLYVAGAAAAQQAWRLEQVATVAVPGGATMAAAFAPDGRTLAMGGERGDLCLIELPAKRQRWMTRPSDHWIGVLAFSPDGAQLACCGRDLTLHDVATGRELDRFPDAGPHGFAWAPDGKRFVWCRGSLLAVHDVAQQATVASWSFEYPVNTSSIAADGTIHAGDNAGRWWQIAPRGRPELVADRRQGESDMTRAIAVAAAGGTRFELASTGPLRGHGSEFAVPGRPFAFATAADGRSFAVGGDQALVRWWTDAGASSRELRVAGHVAALAVHPDGHSLFVSTYDGGQALHGADGTVVALPGHAAEVHGCVLSADGSMLAMQGKQWYLQPVLGGACRPLPGVRSVAAGWRGSEFLLQGETRLRLVEGRTGRELAAVDQAWHSFSEPAMGPGGRFLCGLRNVLVDPTTNVRTELPKPIALFDGAIDVDQTADGTWVAGTAGGIEGESGTLLVTDAAGAPRLVEEGGAVAAVAFSPDGARLFSVRAHGPSFGMGPTDVRLTVRTVRDLAVVREIPVAMSAFRCLDAQQALVCVRGQLQVWDLDSLTAVQTIPVERPWYGFQLAADRRTLVHAASDQVTVYRLRRD